MKAVKHRTKHHHQPTNASCCQTSLAMLLSAHGKEFSPEEIMDKLPVYRNAEDKEEGSINQELATWCLGQGFNVDMYTFDCAIIDQSWSSLDATAQLGRMKLAKEKRNVKTLGEKWSSRYMQTYIDFLQKGGRLHIQPFATTKLLYSLLEKGPFVVGIFPRTTYGKPQSRVTGLRKAVPDDMTKGDINMTHAVVVYGNEANGDFLIADPWEEPGLITINPEALLAGIATAQIECDNLLFQISKA